MMSFATWVTEYMTYQMRAPNIPMLSIWGMVTLK